MEMIMNELTECIIVTYCTNYNGAYVHQFNVSGERLPNTKEFDDACEDLISIIVEELGDACNDDGMFYDEDEAAEFMIKDAKLVFPNCPVIDADFDHISS